VALFISQPSLWLWFEAAGIKVKLIFNLIEEE
jgi:hypothetical protein